MKFNSYSNLDGKHSFLSPSSGYWINYNDEKLIQAFTNMQLKERGTELHAFASYAIVNRIKLAKLKQTLNMFVNDCIGFRMESEKVLYYSENCFGTADAIKLEEEGPNGRPLLKIFDLKTGYVQVTFRQLNIYAAIFCLEYNYNPFDIDIELRVYQNNEVLESIPDPGEIRAIMDKIVHFNKLIEEYQMQQLFG